MDLFLTSSYNYLSIPYKNKKRLLKDFYGIVGPKKGHHRILRQKLKKRPLVLSLKNVILVLKKGKEFF